MIPLTEEKKLDLISLFILDVELDLVCKNAQPYLEELNDVEGVATMPSNFWTCPCGECYPMSFLQVAVNEHAREVVQKNLEGLTTTIPISARAVLTTVFKPGEVMDAKPAALCLKNLNKDFSDLEYSRVDRFHFNLVSRKLKDHITFWEGMTHAFQAMLG
jgi:hypothetical protein